jgi:hypothetical protein
MGPPAPLVLALKQECGIEQFVETGTYRGDTTAWAADNFSRVATVELAAAFHAHAVERFAARSNVAVLHGDSPTVLRQLVPSMTTPTIFWLDAHWCGADSAAQSECPVLGEIDVIDSSPLPHIVLVDDARLFCAPPPRPHRAELWPDLATLVARLHRGGSRYVAQFDDIFVAVPIERRTFLVGWLQDLATRRRAESAKRPWWRLGR